MGISFNVAGWGRRKTILVVDDDADLRLGVEIRLKANGYTVVLATDADESIAATKEHQPDLILLDLGLPGGDGYSVMERLGGDVAMRLIPVVILSARDLRPNRDRSLQGGAYTFLQKPVETMDLIDTIRRALGQAKKEPSRVEKMRLAEEASDRMLRRIV